MFRFRLQLSAIDCDRYQNYTRTPALFLHSFSHVHAIGMVPAPPTPHALPNPRGWTSTRSGWRAEAPGQRNQGVATSRRREPPIQMKIGLPRHPHPPAFPHKDTYSAPWVVLSVNPLGHARCATRGEVRGQMGTEACRDEPRRPPLRFATLSRCDSFFALVVLAIVLARFQTANIASGSPAKCPHGVRHRIFMVALAHPCPLIKEPR